MIAPYLFHADNDADFNFIMEHAVREIDKNLNLKIASTAKEALRSLSQFAIQQHKPRLISLNDNLSDMSLIDLLIQIRQMEYLADIPVIVFFKSGNLPALSKVLQLGANACYQSPMGYRQLVNALKAIFNLWTVTRKQA